MERGGRKGKGSRKGRGLESVVSVNVTRLVVHRGHRWTDRACVKK